MSLSTEVTDVVAVCSGCGKPVAVAGEEQGYKSSHVGWTCNRDCEALAIESTRESDQHCANVIQTLLTQRRVDELH